MDVSGDTVLFCGNLGIKTLIYIIIQYKIDLLPNISLDILNLYYHPWYSSFDFI